MFKRVSVARTLSVCVALTCLLVGIRAFAQVNTADIVGTVTDQAGGVVPGAKITVENLATHDTWINLNGFTIQPRGTPGNETRDQLYGPHQRSVDFSLFKDFPIKERMRLQFRAEAYNISNTENFGQPNVSITRWDGTGPGAHPTQAGNFGQIIQSNLALNPRQFQFALKLIF